jgi:hypothetical protein
MPETKTFKQDLQILKDLQVLDKQIYDFSQELVQIPVRLKNFELEYEKLYAVEREIKGISPKRKIKFSSARASLIW